MTDEEFKKLSPGKSILRTKIDGVEKEVLFKFFRCNTKNFDGYWLLVTEDMSNPNPTEALEEDWETYANLCDVVSFN